MRLVGLLALACVAPACSFDPAFAPGEGPTLTLVDDSAADFGAHAQLEDGVVTPWGTLEPAAFVPGGLRARAFDGNHVDDDDSFEDVVLKAQTFLGAAYRQNLLDFGNGRPPGLGLDRSDDFTIFYEGEILLPEGLQRLELRADDRAIVQIAQDGVTFGQRLFVRTGTASITLDVNRPGWYPIRIALGEAGGNARVLLAIVQQATTPVGPDRLRARITDHTGLVAFAFDAPRLDDAAGETIVPAAEADFGFGSPPYDLDVGFDGFSLRHAGQLRVDAPGTYTFSADVGADTDNLYRIWIDGTLVASTWEGAPAQPSGSIELAAGWHALVFDFRDDLGEARVTLQQDGAPIPTDRLRPAVARGLVAAHAPDTAIDLLDPGAVSHGLDLVAPGDAVIDFVDYGFSLENHRVTDLAVELADCMAPQQLPMVVPSLPTFANAHYFASDARCAGQPASATPAWQLTWTDTTAGNDGLVFPRALDPLLVASYHGGEREPFARSIAFISQPKTIDAAALRLGVARVTAAADGAAIELAVRAAADEATLATEPWTVVESGKAPALALPAEPGALVQYALAVSGDGWQFPSIDKVELDVILAE